MNNRLSSLDINCFNNMPMLVDVINKSTTSLGNILGGWRDKIQHEVEKSLPSKRWCIKANENGYIEWGELELHSCISVIRGKKEVVEVSCSYIVSEDNHIFFQLTESDICSLLTEEFKNSIDVDSRFIKVCNEEKEENFVSVELKITPDLSEKQIEDCACEFINKVLRPYLDLLTSTFCN